MENIKVCRICLLMDVKMFNFHSYPLETYYDILVGNTTTIQELPKYACYECSAQLNKFYLFREKCLRGQAALLGLKHSCVKVTGEVIKQLDKEVFKLSSNIGFSEVTFTNVNPITDIDLKDDEIKVEPFEIVDNGEYFDEKDFKREDNDNDSIFSNNDRILSSDDDQPLSKHKEKKKEKRGRKRKKSDVEKQVEVDKKIDSDFISAESATVSQETISDVKPKRGRPRKTDGSKKKKKEVRQRRTNNTGGVSDEDLDLENYCTIVTLTEEEQKEEIRQRQKSSNYLNAIYQCKLCFKGFIDAQAWEHHLSKHEPSSGDIECPICKFRFKTKRILQKHASNHEKKYECKSCSYVSKTTTQAKQHQRWHKGVTYKCQYCDEISTKWTSYLSHVRIKHPSEFICGACGYSFVSRLGLAMHRTMMHKALVEKEKTEGETNDMPYCAQCDVKFVSTEAYKRHMFTSSKHTQSKDFK
ncbi:unnamed protein product [Euphydryas editha]|uniref:Uncharacterized protein n=1 Tax=Euphydryas editha TaxID=104508 RepID=A0AAU9TMJ2_EUPED|nr:unnamed protein product [Euphydryas editha]